VQLLALRAGRALAALLGLGALAGAALATLLGGTLAAAAAAVLAALLGAALAVGGTGAAGRRAGAGAGLAGGAGGLDEEAVTGEELVVGGGVARDDRLPIDGQDLRAAVVLPRHPDLQRRGRGRPALDEADRVEHRLVAGDGEAADLVPVGAAGDDVEELAVEGEEVHGDLRPFQVPRQVPLDRRPGLLHRQAGDVDRAVAAQADRPVR